jgi:hypothetical protein
VTMAIVLLVGGALLQSLTPDQIPASVVPLSWLPVKAVPWVVKGLGTALAAWGAVIGFRKLPIKT